MSLIKSDIKNTEKPSGGFKAKLTSIIQKIAVIILASIMLLNFLPVGLMPDSGTLRYNGEYLKLYPESESYSAENPGSGTAGIGLGGGAYLRFNLDQLKDIDEDDIKSVHLRLAFLKGSGYAGGSVIVSLPQASDAFADGLVLALPAPAEEFIETLNPKTGGAGDSLSQVDLTSQIKNAIDSNKSEISVRLSGRSPVRATLACGAYSDPGYRPCLSIVTGTAEDEASGSLEKTTLADATFVSKDESDATGTDLSPSGGFLAVDSSREAYLKFNINEHAIFGNPYEAVLSLNRIWASNGTESDGLRIYCINNDEWSSGGISYNNRPRGDERLASPFFAEAPQRSGRINFDVSQAVCAALSRGITTLTFRITALNGSSIYFSGANSGAAAPNLYIRVTDDRNLSAAAEAALNALGRNRQSFVTMDLADSYETANGTDAKIRWTELNGNTEDITGRHVDKNGGITRPKWFEGNAETLAVARIRSGKHELRREYLMTVPAEAAPNYSNRIFGNYIEVGDSQSEKEQAFDFIRFSGTKWRWADGGIFTYRVPETNGAAVLNLACEPRADNYLTLKLWEGDDAQSQVFKVGLLDGAAITLTAPPVSASSDDLFVYATYALPRSFTEGKSSVSLRLTCTESDGTDTDPRGIYAVYMTQSPYFDPILFAEQGEKVMSEPSFGETAIQSFIDNILSIGDTFDFDDTEPTDDSPAQTLKINDERGSVIAVGTGTNIAFSINEADGTAAVYQRLEYFDRYSSGMPVVSSNGLVAVDYGRYKLIWNRHGKTDMPIPYNRLDMTGEYQDITAGLYYNFSDREILPSDSIIPDDAVLYDGKTLTVPAGGAVLLRRLDDPMQNSDWRISMINDRAIHPLSFKDGEKLKSVTVRAAGDIREGADSLTVMFCVYKNGKLVSMGKENTELLRSANIYTLDFSESELHITKGDEIKVFVYDSAADMTALSPGLDIIL